MELTRRTRWALLYCAYVVAVLVAFTFGYNAHPDTNGPSCETEDACTIDYHSGEWHITETNP